LFAILVNASALEELTIMGTYSHEYPLRFWVPPKPGAPKPGALGLVPLGLVPASGWCRLGLVRLGLVHPRF